MKVGMMTSHATLPRNTVPPPPPRTVQWLVVITVDLRRNDWPGLANRVTYGTANCTSAHRAEVARDESDYSTY